MSFAHVASLAFLIVGMLTCSSTVDSLCTFS